VSRTVVEKFIRQTVNKLMNGFEVKNGVYVRDGGTSGIITNDSKTFGFKKLKMTVVRRRCIAPDGDGIGKYGADQ